MNQSSERHNPLRVCFIHDWLVTMRGGEKVLEAMVELFPDAPIFTLFAKKEALSDSLKRRKIYSSFLQYIPRIDLFYRWLLPIFPFAVRSFNLKSFDFVISSSHCVAKGVRVSPNAVHVCYCHSPMRYLWDFTDVYLERFPRIIKWLVKKYFQWMKKWDYATSQQVSHFIANSKNIARKIKNFYHREAVVIHPPIEMSPKATGSKTSASDHEFYLIVSAFVPYKRVDLAIEAFNQLKKPLRIVGNGPLKKELQQRVRYHGIQFEGWLSPSELWDRYQKARALIFPGEEDFGIVPVEAQMCGTPVIAYGKGGILDSVVPGSGVFFYEPTVNALVKAVENYEQLDFDPDFIREHARQFNRERFKKEISDFIESISDGEMQLTPQIFCGALGAKRR